MLLGDTKVDMGRQVLRPTERNPYIAGCRAVASALRARAGSL
jgi:hypothetical protein